jgi:(p)ppGpp synthase/HD superfamily hydrolase
VTTEPPSVLAQARELALRSHAEQRYGNRPYSVHLEAVQDVLARFGIDDEVVRAAAWLHDVLEDNPNVRREDLERSLPEDVVAIVDACTDGEGESREQRKQRPLGLIPKTPNAVLVKLADRIANVEASIHDHHDGRLAMYRQEHDTFVDALRKSPSEPSAAPMWSHLEHILAPRR